MKTKKSDNGQKSTTEIKTATKNPAPKGTTGGQFKKFIKQ